MAQVKSCQPFLEDHRGFHLQPLGKPSGSENRRFDLPNWKNPSLPVIPPEIKVFGWYVFGIQSYQTSVSAFGSLGKPFFQVPIRNIYSLTPVS